ncbi:MAG: cytochrome c biogenesis protein [Thermodesulfobacteriota bacterium]
MKILLYIMSLVLMILATYAVFLYAPNEVVMGPIQRIFYFHMGSVWVATIAFILVFISSIAYLINRKIKWDILAYCSAEIGVLFITITIITGSIWAKPVWGTWWTWDPQLTTTFILWILYIVYLLIRANSGYDERKAKYSAVFAIIAFLDLPLVYISARVMRGISPVVFGPGGGGIEPKMMHTLLLTLVAFTLLFLILIIERVRIEKMKYKISSIKYAEDS